jgi:Leucine-rich repeat (LRR) protein
MQKNYKNIVTIENNDTEKELYHRVKKLFDSENAYDELKACTTIHHEGMCREVLDLRGRKMAKIDKGMFTRLGSLEKILLADSHIEEIEEGAFGGLGKLRVLDLSSNRLKKLKKGMFRGLSRLEYLNLNNNNIEEIEEGAFEGLGELRELNVDCNHINRIKKGCFEGANLLTVLYARNNKLNAIEEGAFEGLVRLSIVNLKSNPLRSAEILQQIKKELLLKEINPAHKNQGYVIIVTDPDPSKSTPLIEHGNCPLMWLETSFWAR